MRDEVDDEVYLDCERAQMVDLVCLLDKEDIEHHDETKGTYHITEPFP